MHYLKKLHPVTKDELPKEIIQTYNEVLFTRCSADCDTMWQIGVDVLPEYRRNGIASALTSKLAIEIINRGKIPFYRAAWSNIRSVRNAIKSGFRPSWVEMTAKSHQYVSKMNLL
ncbi:MAG TPA: hypothetical protein GX731_00840 [Clostridiales bacterium]|nr:hypothetical protein [Clostridiales bacterium]